LRRSMFGGTHETTRLSCVCRCHPESLEAASG
jgi:hypothetical protein